MRELALQRPEGAEGLQGKNNQGTGSRAGACLACSRNSKEARVAGESEQREACEMGSEKWDRTAQCHVGLVRTFALSLNETEVLGDFQQNTGRF